MSDALLSRLIAEGYAEKTWHGPNLRQSIRGVTAAQAAWRPAPGAHNIWEFTLHAAYWKYVIRRKIEGGKRRAFALEGSNFFKRPEAGKATESAWRADRDVLEREHRALAAAVRKSAAARRSGRIVRGIYGVAFHDVYHAGQIRLLRRLIEKRKAI